MTEYKRFEGETDEALILRICRDKPIIGSWDDVCAILNKLLGANYRPNTYRNKFQSYDRLHRVEIDKSDSELLNEIKEQRRELEKERKKVVDGDKIKFVYLKTPNPTKEECIAFQDSFPKEFKLNKYVDYNLMFEKAFLKTIETMIEPLGWKPKRETYLDDFFSYE